MRINKVTDFLLDQSNQSNDASKLSQQESINILKQEQLITGNFKNPISRLNNDFNSQKIRDAIINQLSSNKEISQSTQTTKPTSTPSSADYKTQALIKNLSKVSVKLEKTAIQYCNKISESSDSLKSSIKEFLTEVKNHTKTLEEHLSTLDNNSINFTTQSEITKLVTELKTISTSIESLTKGFLYNTNNNLKDFNKNIGQFQSSTKDLNNGNAFAIFGVLNSFENIQTIPEIISKNSKIYKSEIDQNVNLLTNKSNVIRNKIPSENQVDKLKNSVLSLANSSSTILETTYRFNYPNEYTAPLVKAYYQSLQNLASSILFPDTNPKGKPISESLLVLNTNDLRQTIKLAEQGDLQAKEKLKIQYGYTLDNAPKAGQMLLAANFVRGDLENGQVNASHFPGSSRTKPINTNPPEVKKLLFGEDLKGQVAIKNKEGKTVIANSEAEYKNIIANNRSKAGIPTNNGEPLPVHVSFEGGGGLGKRHAAAVSEMYNLGLVPASVSGVSAGSINAGFIAAGLNPNKADEISRDPQIKKFLEVNPLGGPGLTTGREFYRYMDQKLREVTGIKDRPVTFADLKMPLYIGATKLADSQAPNDMTKLEDRIFVFSKETTPDTPVAMAMTASAAVPGSFDPVDFVDVASGRTIRLVDGGMINNLPIGYQKNNLPEIALKLQMPNTNNPNSKLNNASVKPFSPGNLTSYTSFGNTQIGVKLYLDSAQDARNFKQRTNPPDGTFVLNIPTWNLKNFVEQDNVVDYQYDKDVDPELDQQTFELTDNFLRQFFTKLKDPSKSGTNLKPVPKETGFSRQFNLNGVNWTVERQPNNDKVTFHSNTGETHQITLGKERLENWLADDASFGDLVYRLKDVLVDYQKYASIGFNPWLP